MIRYILRQFGTLIPTLLIVGAITFALVQVVPGDPVRAVLGEDASAEAVARLRASLGLDDPMVLRFVRWISGVVRGDLGTSITSSEPVLQRIVGRLEPTFLLVALSMLIAVTLGLLAGVLSAVYRGSFVDQALLVVSLLGVAMPNFWLGLNLILLLAVNLELLPVAGYVPLRENWTETLRFLAMPALALGFSQAAIVSRITRTSILEVLGLDYIRTARSKGVNERVVLFKHALRNALISILAVVGTIVAVLLGGSIVIEIVFNLPGLGRLVITAVQQRDYPVVQGVLLFITGMNVLVHLLLDLAYAGIDPRIRYS